MGSIRERRVMENAIDDSGRGQRNRRNKQAFNDIPENVLQAEGDQNARPSQGNQTGVVLQFMEALTNYMKNQKPRNDIFEFIKFDPPAFEGSADPLDADKWLRRIEKIFMVMNFDDDDDDEKVRCASYMLQGGADDWWQMEELRQKADPEPYTWDKFKTAFYDRYFPKYVRQQKVNEFIKLIQGDMSVDEYENKFYGLLKFALELYPTEESCAWRFQQGLRPEINLRLAPFELKTITEVATRAKVVEWCLDDVQKENDCHQRKRSRPAGLQVGEDVPLKKPETKGRDHRNTGACFGCGQKGHLVADCPHKKS